jgi:hypothetical protein
MPRRYTGRATRVRREEAGRGEESAVVRMAVAASRAAVRAEEAREVAREVVATVVAKAVEAMEVV